MSRNLENVQPFAIKSSSDWTKKGIRIITDLRWSCRASTRSCRLANCPVSLQTQVPHSTVNMWHNPIISILGSQLHPHYKSMCKQRVYLLTIDFATKISHYITIITTHVLSRSGRHSNMAVACVSWSSLRQAYTHSSASDISCIWLWITGAATYTPTTTFSVYIEPSTQASSRTTTTFL